MREHKGGRGGARPGAGRKKRDRSMLHTSVDNTFLQRLKEEAQKENLTVGNWLVKHVQF